MVGDSIKGGYWKYVAHALKDTCEVYSAPDNCRFAQYCLRYLHVWKQNLELGDDIDLVHWNVGLWDTIEFYEDGCLTPPEFYAYYIDKICNRIKRLFPNTKIVFATTTPILEHKFLRPKFAMRKNATVREYNVIATEICKKHGCAITDLYSAVENVPEEYYSDLTHLNTPEGAEVTTNTVLKSICNVLDLEYREFKMENYEEVKEVEGF